VTIKTKAIIGVSAIMMFIAIVAVLPNQLFNKAVNNGNFREAVISDEVSTFDCEIPVHKPNYISLTCADGGIAVKEIRWQSWNPKEAIGTGVYMENDCLPDCASGKFQQTAVEISLRSLIQYKSDFYLKDLVINTTNGNTFPSGTTSIKVDLMEYLLSVES
jgi:hypothetical protein